MTVLSIDPGTTQSAFVLYDPVGPRLIKFGKIDNELLKNFLRYGALYELMAFSDLPNKCVIEMIQHYGTGMPAGKEVFETCVWIGKFELAFEIFRSGCEVWKISRPSVKSHICHSARAKDGNVRQALIDRFGAPGTKKDPGFLYGVSGDIWSALAVAVTWTDNNVGNS